MIIPYNWQDILAMVQRIDPHAIIAGGCLRDLDNSRSIKDLDIFCQYNTDIYQVANILQGQVDEDCPNASIQNEMFATSSIVKLGGKFKLDIALNVINVGRTIKPVERAKKFDFGICQIWYDGRRTYSTYEYDSDKRDKRFTLRYCVNPEMITQSFLRYARLQYKYDWPLFIPSEFAQYIRQNNAFRGSDELKVTF